MDNKKKIIATTAIILASVTGLFLLLDSNDEQVFNITYTPSTDKICKEGRCNLVLYSGVRNVYEDETWKRAEDARSLKGKGYEIVFKQIDSNYPVKVLDFNMTHVIVKFQGKRKVVQLDINKTFKFGRNSTTIQLQDADTENLDDSYTDDNNRDSNYGTATYLRYATTSTNPYNAKVALRGVIKFNTSIIPDSSTIERADLYMYAYSETLDSGETLGVVFYHVYEYPTYNISDSEWDEETITHNNMPSTSVTNMSIQDIELFADGFSPFWAEWNVTDWMNNSFAASEETLTLIAYTSRAGGYSGTFDYVSMYSKEYGEDTTLRPYLNVTYTEVAVDTCTCAGLNEDWEIDMSDYCNITDACDLGTGTLSFTGAGWCSCNASVDTTNLGDPGASGVLYIQDSCLITID